MQQDNPEWQLNNDQPMLICVDCHRLVPRHHPLQNRCRECHQKRRRKTAQGKAQKKAMRQTRDRRERAQTVHDGGYQKPRTWAKSQKLVCAICQRPLTLETAEVDHIKPLCLGGDNHPRNFQILCHECHKIKTVGDNLWINLENQGAGVSSSENYI